MRFQLLVRHGDNHLPNYYRFVPHCNAMKHSGRCSNTTENEYFFSIATFFNALIPQAVALVAKNSDAMYACSSVTDYPVFSMGLAGVQSPQAVLLVSGLLPYSNERGRYIERLSHVLHYYEYQIGELFDEHNEELAMNYWWTPFDDSDKSICDAYKNLMSYCRGKRTLILDEINYQTRRLIDHLADKDELMKPILPNEILYHSTEYGQ